RTLAFSPQGLFLHVDGDAQRLEKAFHHLLTYALHVPNSVGPVELTLAEADDHALIRTCVSGPLWPLDQKPTFLDLLSDEHDGDAPPDMGGWHVGLALVRSVVELHGGRITLGASESGHGNEITVRLPLAKAGTKSTENLSANPTPAASRRVLVIEDD